MEQFVIIEAMQLILMVIASVIITFAHFRRRDLLEWVIAYYTFTLAIMFDNLRNESIIFYYLAVILFFLTMLILFIGIKREYNLIFQDNLQDEKSRTNILLLMDISFFLAVFEISIYVLLLILLIINIVLLARIYIRKRTPTHAFLLFSLVISSTGSIAEILEYLEIDWAYEFNIGTSTVIIMLLLVTGVIALIEARIKKTEDRYRNAYNRSNFFKDLFTHDISNILHVIKSASEINSRSLNNLNTDDLEELRENNSIIEKQVERGYRLVSKVQLISNAEEDSYHLSNKNIKTILEEAIQNVRMSFSDKNLDVKVSSFDGNLSVKANDLLLGVFENILQNSVRHNNNLNVDVIVNVSIERKRNNDYVRLEFIDNGKGIPDARKESIFTRSNQKSDVSEGLGMGLSLVRKIIEGYKGRIWVENRVRGNHAEGCIFNVLLEKS